MYLGSYGLRKPWLDKCLKSLKSKISEDLSKSYMVNGSKPC